MKDGSPSELKPTLGLLDATAIGIGAIIGGGIFVVTGIVAGLAGPGLVVSIILAAAVAALTALSFVELTAWLPKEGSVYEFAHRLISPFAGFLTGWMWIVSNTFIGAAVALGFSYYFVALVPAVNPRLIAAAMCVLFTLFNYVGVRHSATLNNVLVSTKVLILLVFTFFGAFHINQSNFAPLITSGTGVLQGAYFIFFAYGGFGRVAVIAEEVKDARRTVPRSIVLALAISTAIYVLVGTVAVGLVGAQNLARSESPLAEAINIVGNQALTSIVSMGGMVATATVLLTSILGVSRMAFAMARREDLPKAVRRLHSRYGTPHISILIVGVLTTLLALFVDLTGVVGVSTFALLFYYALANLSALRLGSDAALYPKALPAAGLATCVILLIFVELPALEIGAACLAFGALYYTIREKRKQ